MDTKDKQYFCNLRSKAVQYRVFLGVYSSENTDFGGSRRRLYFAWDTGQGSYEVQRVSNDFKPVDLVQPLTERQFRDNFVHEPDLRSLARAAERSSTLPTVSGRVPAGPQEVEATLREHFRKSMLRCKRPSEREAACKALLTLAEVEEGIEPEHKHMFTEFGISLRKERMFALAQAFCQRALSLSPEDDHAYFNMARVLLDMDNVNGAEQHILTALDMNPGSNVYKKMLHHVQMMKRRKRR